MAILEDEQRTLVIGVVAGLAAAGLVKYLAPAFSGVGRPLLKGLIKQGLTTYESGREAFAQAAEVVEDLFAEARAELQTELAEAHGRDSDAMAPIAPRGNGGA
jgi:hypothetical protein